MKRWVPNLLTLTRVAACPFIVASLFQRRATETFIYFVIAAISDLLDGYLARRWKVESSWGATLDPICDKIFVVSLYSALMTLGACPIWFFALLVTVTLLQMVGLTWLNSRGACTSVTRLGKWNLGAQMIWIGILLIDHFVRLRHPSLSSISRAPHIVTFVVLAGLQVAVFYQYATRFGGRFVPRLRISVDS